jgi:quinolinate synthase
MTAAATSAPSRSNPAGNVLQTIYKRTRALLGELPRFPSLMITADSLQPQGAFAEAQAQYLEPDMKQVIELTFQRMATMRACHILQML